MSGTAKYAPTIMGEHLYTYVDPPNARHLDEIVDVLDGGGIIALPTGTSWAFAGLATSKKADKAIRRLKPGHPDNRPFALMCHDISMATSMTRIDGAAYRLLRRLWPGPYTVLLNANHQLPKVLKTKRAVVGVRIPQDPLATAILEYLGSPLMVSTVPRLDGVLPTMGFEVQERFGHGLDLVVDLGDPLPGVETTVLDLTSGDIEIVREGAGSTEGL